MFNLGVLIPGISISTGGLASQDVGGALGPETRALVAHGGNTNDQRFMMNGVSLSSMIGGGWGGGAIPNATGVQEMVFDTASVNADLATAACASTSLPVRAAISITAPSSATANSSMQTTNVNAELLARNPALINAGTVDKNWDFNPGFGGPIKRDKIWFFASGRSQGARPRARHVLQQERQRPTKWTYDPDLAAGVAREDLAGCASSRLMASESEEQDRLHLHAAGLLRVSRRHHSDDGTRGRLRSPVPDATGDPARLDLSR